MEYCSSCFKELEPIKDYGNYSIIDGEYYCYSCAPSAPSSSSKKPKLLIPPKKQEPTYEDSNKTPQHENSFKNDNSYSPKGFWNTLLYYLEETEFMKPLIVFACLFLFIFLIIIS